MTEILSGIWTLTVGNWGQASFPWSHQSVLEERLVVLMREDVPHSEKCFRWKLGFEPSSWCLMVRCVFPESYCLNQTCSWWFWWGEDVPLWEKMMIFWTKTLSGIWTLTLLPVDQVTNTELFCLHHITAEKAAMIILESRKAHLLIHSWEKNFYCQKYQQNQNMKSVTEMKIFGSKTNKNTPSFYFTEFLGLTTNLCRLVDILTSFLSKASYLEKISHKKGFG